MFRQKARLGRFCSLETDNNRIGMSGWLCFPMATKQETISFLGYGFCPYFYRGRRTAPEKI